MARLGDGTEGMATSIAMATLAPGGTVVVPAALVMDEVEHHRAGIGCMLESTGNGEVHVSVVVPGGAAHANGLQEGDVIESIDGQRLRPGRGGVEQLSSLIRGPSGSYVEVGARFALFDFGQALAHQVAGLNLLVPRLHCTVLRNVRGCAEERAKVPPCKVARYKRKVT